MKWLFGIVSTKRKAAVAIFAATVLIRFIFYTGVYAMEGGSGIEHVFIPGSDAKRYLQLADNIRQKGTFSSSEEAPLLPEQEIEPAYPLFLAGSLELLDSPYIVMLFQILLAGLSASILYLLGTMFLPSGAAFLAGLLFAFDPVGIFLSGAVFTESLFVFFFLSFLYFFSRSLSAVPKARDFAGTGVFLALSALTRPETQFFPVVAALFYAVRFGLRPFQVFAKPLFIFLIGFILVMSPWLIRNKVMFGSYQTSSMSFHKLYLFDLLYFYSYKNGVSFQEAREVFRNKVSAISPLGNDDPVFENAPYIKQVTLEYIGGHPISFGIFYAVKTMPFFLSDGLRYAASKFDIVSAPEVNISRLVLEGEFTQIAKAFSGKEGVSLVLFLLGSMFWFCVNALMVYAVWKSVVQKNRQVMLPVLALFLMVLIFACMSGTVSNPRLRYKAAPLMYILAMGGLSYLFHPGLDRKNAFQNVFKNDRA